MTRVLIIFLFVLAGFALGPLLQNQQGYVYIEFANYEMTTSFTVFVLLLVLLFTLLYFSIRLIRGLFRLASVSGDWFSRSALNRSGKKADKAQTKVLEGDYKKAEKLLARSAKSARRPALHYLQAAEAAQLSGDNTRAYALLEQAAAVCTEEDQLAFDIVRTRIQIENKEAQAAKTSVDRLLKQKPRHPEILRLAERAYLLSGDYLMLISLLPTFYKVQIHDDTTLDKLSETVYLRLIRQLAQQDASQLIDWWQAQPRRVRENALYQNEVASQFVAIKADDAAKQAIIDGLKQHFDAGLVNLIHQLSTGYDAKLEKVLRKKLKSESVLSSADSALLYRTLAHLAMKNQDWKQAQTWLQKAVSLHETEEDQAMLAQLATQQSQS